MTMYLYISEGVGQLKPEGLLAQMGLAQVSNSMKIRVDEVTVTCLSCNVSELLSRISTSAFGRLDRLDRLHVDGAEKCHHRHVRRQATLVMDPGANYSL